MNTDQGIWKTMIIKPIFIKLNSFVNQKCKNLLFCIIAVLPPNIFMFHFYSKNADYVDYWHVFIVSAVFSIGGLLLYWIISRIGKSQQRSSLVCVFLWIMFFTIFPLYRNFKPLYHLELNLTVKTLLVLIPVLVFTVIIFNIGHRIKHIEIFKILAVFETVVFLFNFIQASAIYVSDKTVIVSESNYKTSFVVDTSSPSPNIYWLHMDGMLGFRAMEYFFNDPQIKFETMLSERGFVVNREAEFEAGHNTVIAIPALMSPFFYDKVMFSWMISTNLLVNKKYFYTKITPVDLLKARLNNELITAFNAKRYQTNTIATMDFYYFLTTNLFYFRNRKVKYDFTNLAIAEQLTKWNNLRELINLTTPIIFISRTLQNYIIVEAYKKYLNVESIKEYDVDTNEIYGNFYGKHGKDIWHINALSEIFDGPQPRMTIIHDLNAHVPFVLNEEGAIINRKGEEMFDLYNYPPQHHFVRNYLIALIDLIITNDPDAVIVVQADHGLHHENSRKQILSSGGTEDEVRLIYNQTMSAVRIPDKWGGLDAPLDPLNITRVLVNRYVGQNYELLENHP